MIVAGAAGSANASEIESDRIIKLNVHGRITEQCQLGSGGTVSFGDLNRPGLQMQTRVQFSCNVPFDVTVQAANGGLANEQYPDGQGPYAGSLPYTLDLQIPVLRPAAAVVSRNLASRELVGSGRSLSSGGGIALDGMQMSIVLGKPSGEAGLLAGNYAETIVITVSPS